ncbi:MULTISPECIES: hypothetical protein [Pseudomonas]|uniref:Uncharacterized protein n=1 Tax=Pseudomonas entomophila TaxID=312306 RepID=A0A3Q8U4Q7_9PSED|nr:MULTISPECIES: hypothetical protein [Pseudomonas]AZL71124.1 hypothetical protein EJA05_26775 [Pseudomonas oryziphila]MDZ4018861.1 hypothetical protein [Pseudomonas sichuanensis]UVL89086.1 hypothetical protein LOY51_25600 [Pseudomonas sichuanensis]
MATHQNKLQPARIKEADSEGVVSLAALQVGVTVIIPWSELFEIGYRFHIVLGEFSAGIDVKNLGNDIECFFPAEKLIGMHGQRVKLYYQSLELPVGPSDETTYQFEAALYHPVVDAVIGGLLPRDAVENGYTIKIPVFPGMAVSDTIRLFLACPLLDASKVMDIPVSDTSSPIEVRIGNETSSRADGGNVHIVYQVVRGGAVLNSPAIHFECPKRLEPPMPTHVLSYGRYPTVVMALVEEGDGQYEFYTTPGDPFEQGDEAFLLAFKPTSSISAIAQGAIEQSTGKLKFRLPKDTLFYLFSYRVITLVRRGTTTYSSGMTNVEMPVSTPL